MDDDRCLSIREIKVILRANAALARCGLAHVPIRDAAQQVRQAHIRRVGARRYLYDLLGARANRPLAHCTLLCEGEEVTVSPTGQDQRLVDFLERLPPDQLPDCIQIEEGKRLIRLHI